MRNFEKKANQPLPPRLNNILERIVKRMNETGQRPTVRMAFTPSEYVENKPVEMLLPKTENVMVAPLPPTPQLNPLMKPSVPGTRYGTQAGNDLNDVFYNTGKQAEFSEESIFEKLAEQNVDLFFKK